MKPLTIEQLRNLEIYAWVWIRTFDRKGYYRVSETSIDGLICKSFSSNEETYKYSDYDTKWLAYKNKEAAEAKGEIMELPCKVGDTVYRLHKYTKEIIEWEVMVIEIGEAETLFICGHSGTKDYMVFGETEIGGLFFTDKSEAERRLAELTKE